MISFVAHTRYIHICIKNLLNISPKFTIAFFAVSFCYMEDVALEIVDGGDGGDMWSGWDDSGIHKSTNRILWPILRDLLI